MCFTDVFPSWTAASHCPLMFVVSVVAVVRPHLLSICFVHQSATISGRTVVLNAPLSTNISIFLLITLYVACWGEGAILHPLSMDDGTAWPDESENNYFNHERVNMTSFFDYTVILVVTLPIQKIKILPLTGRKHYSEGFYRHWTSTTFVIKIYSQWQSKKE